jgi:hypothetical protein
VHAGVLIFVTGRAFDLFPVGEKNEIGPPMVNVRSRALIRSDELGCGVTYASAPRDDTACIFCCQSTAEGAGIAIVAECVDQIRSRERAVRRRCAWAARPVSPSPPPQAEEGDAQRLG